jgi:hypothetical protein
MERAVQLITLSMTLLLGSLAATPLPAEEIYRWVDENGVVNFSDTAPAARSRSVSTVAVEDTRPSDYDPEADIYNVEAQAERMQALREEMQARREARLEEERNAAQRTPAQSAQPVGYALPPWWWDRPGYGKPPRPPERPQPPIPEPYPTSTLRPPGQTNDR